MNTETARRQAEKTMKKFGLTDKGWEFQWNNARGTAGYCTHHIKVLSFSKFLCEHGDEQEWTDTVMHEIAHALVGRGKGHGPVWKAKMRELGQEPRRTTPFTETQVDALVKTANYVLTCSVTGKELARRHRKRTDKVCKCHGSLVLWNGLPF